LVSIRRLRVLCEAAQRQIFFAGVAGFSAHAWIIVYSAEAATSILTNQFSFKRTAFL
jgi:hypothetical protein